MHEVDQFTVCGDLHCISCAATAVNDNDKQLISVTSRRLTSQVRQLR